ncbi:MAG: c-type cytochrome biogenesis protein CcmI [Betaproteobacteria bacterium RIFCSPLOWO2_02_FULL_63_19]|nr:MAG: c-type cytochrome biogenesis protein CcmI [Betaproteobacteria bacterium RIFCSPLOWO2_02_FULL_63_19]
MTAFLAVAAVMVIGALLTVLPPLLARRDAEATDRGAANIALLRRELENNDADLQAGTIDRDQWQSARREIERRVIDESQAGAEPVVSTSEHSPRVALLLAVVMPVAAIAAYVALGEPRALSGAAPAPVQAAGHPVETEQVLAMAEALARKLKASPEDGSGWAMLGRTYAYAGRVEEALKAFEEAMKRIPDDARLIADYADLYASSKGAGSLAGEPEKLIRRALSLNPNEPKALALSGTIAFRNRDFAAAARQWEQALSVLPEDSEFARQIASGLAQARRALGVPAGATPGATAAAGGAPAQSVASGVSVSGMVTIAPDLAMRASPDDALFIFARLPEGGGPPLAVMRAKFGQLPLNFELDDSMAMSPENTLSRATRVVITARVAKSGGVVPKPGDLEGASKPVAPGASGVAVRIDKTL